ncbi:alpha/beta hydrolase [Phyllobacterium sp. LjRoot231]|uniref:alpha/beta fold hydrolase n=1 Tax=Phyllobacterium sp. LjRoot231 TaxID=3342289 RepID=UPI003ECC4BCE
MVREITFDAPDGLKLYARVYEPAREVDSLPLVCLPGLTRNARDFHELAEALAQHAETPRRVISFDYRGRGLSAYDPDFAHYNIGTEAGDVIAGLGVLGIDRGVFLGTSRGGLIIHILAAIAPQFLAGVILNDIGPEIAPAGLLQISQYLNGPRHPKNWADAVEVQRAVHGAAFPALRDADWERFAHAIYREIDGVISPDHDPNLIKTLQGIDFTKELPDLWAQFDLLAELPLLVIRGENTPLLAPETVEEMTRRHPALQLINVAGQGHAPLLETGRLPELIAAFVAGVDLRAV